MIVEPVDETTGTTPSADISMTSRVVDSDDEGDEVSGPRNEATVVLASRISRMIPRIVHTLPVVLFLSNRTIRTC